MASRYPALYDTGLWKVAEGSGSEEPEFRKKFHTRICPYLHVVIVDETPSNFIFSPILNTSSPNSNALKYDNRHRKDQTHRELHKFYASPGKLEARWTTTSTPSVTHLAILGTRSGISLSLPQYHHHWLHLSALLRKLDETPLFQTPIQLEMLVDLVRALSRSAYSPYRRGRLRHS